MRRVWEAVCRLLLRAYPAAFRERNGEEILRLLREQDRTRRGWRRLSFRVGAAASLGWNGILERTRVTGSGRHETRGGGGMGGLVKDARYAWRALRRSPGFTLVAVVTVALGIAANTAIFTVVRGVLLAPLPYPEPDELVVFFGEMRNRGVTHFPSSPPDFRDYREQADLFEEVGAVFTFPQALTGEGEPLQLNVATVTDNFFQVLGVEPLMGRTFLPEDVIPEEEGVQPDDPGALPTRVVLGHALWQQHFGGDPQVVGRAVTLGGRLAEVVGVLPPDFRFLMPPGASLDTEVDLWAAGRINYATAPRNNVFLRPVGRLADGVTVEQAQAQIDRIASGLPDENQVKATSGYAMRLEPLHGSLTAEVRPVLLSLMGAVLFVLLIACANVANLLLVRASTREREMAVRAAMGGSRLRLTRQLLLESGILAGMGALAGVVLARGGVWALLALRPPELPRLGDVRMDGTVLVFTALVAAAAAAIFGLAPALAASRTALADALKDRGSASVSRGRRWVRGSVVVAEVALSLVLLIGAGLMVRSFVELTRVEPGYEPTGALVFEVSLPFARYPTPADRGEVLLRIQEEVGALPGVERAAAAFPVPLSGELMNGRYGNEEALSDPSAFRQADFRFVLPGYFEAMGTQVLEGRAFTRADYADSAAVVVVDRLLADRLWPGEPAVGKRFLTRVITPQPEWVEVVGVVEHQRSDDLAAPGLETIYFHDRYAGSFAQDWVVRTGAEPLSLVPALRERLARVDPDLPLAEIRTLEAMVDEAMGPTRFALTLIGLFGVVALVLACVGLYGVLSYVVRQRRAEIGVRMAFGAESGSILRLVVGQGMALAGVGVTVGVLAALPLTRFMESLLVEVSPGDPVTFGGISLIFVAVAALACWIPAHRASRTDPVKALREE